MMGYGSGKGIFVIFLLEGFNLLNIINKVLDLVELGEGLGRNQIAQVLFNLHSNLYTVQGVEPVVWQCALLAQSYISVECTLLVGGAVVVLHSLDHVWLNVLCFLQHDLASSCQLSIFVVSEPRRLAAFCCSLLNLISEFESSQQDRYVFEHMFLLKIILT